MTRSFILSLYLTWSARGGPAFAERRLRKRLEAGKEDDARVQERRGISNVARPDGPLIWFHAASVAESLSVLELIRRALDAREDLTVLITTGTVTAASVMADRMPDRAIHQYAPLDTTPYVTAFLAHWKPDVAIWTESEFWPTLMVETHARDIPMLLLNARLSKASFDKWRFLRGMARSLLERFQMALVQDAQTTAYLRSLGMAKDRMQVLGTLKEGATALPCDESTRAALASGLAGRPVWLAALTKEGEEDMVLQAHRKAMRSSPRLLLIIVPHDPKRGDEIAAQLQADHWRFTRRAAGEEPEDEASVYLADTHAEMGLWYRLSPISFIGGSLVATGGNNPFEPAALGSAILHGPYVSTFADAYDRLRDGGAARLVTSPEKLAGQVSALLNPDEAATMATAAWQVISEGADVTDRALALVIDTLEDAETP